MSDDKRDRGRPVPNHGSGPGGPAWQPPKDQPKFSDGGFGAVDLRELFGSPRDPGKDGALGAPWKISRDNAYGITVLDRDGDVVWEEMWSNVPAKQPNRPQVIATLRRRIRCVVVAINCHDDFITKSVAVLAELDDMLGDLDEKSVEHDRLHEAAQKLSALATQAVALTAEA